MEEKQTFIEMNDQMVQLISNSNHIPKGKFTWLLMSVVLG